MSGAGGEGRQGRAWFAPLGTAGAALFTSSSVHTLLRSHPLAFTPSSVNTLLRPHPPPFTPRSVLTLRASSACRLAFSRRMLARGAHLQVLCRICRVCLCPHILASLYFFRRYPTSSGTLALARAGRPPRQWSATCPWNSSIWSILGKLSGSAAHSAGFRRNRAVGRRISGPYWRRGSARKCALPSPPPFLPNVATHNHSHRAALALRPWLCGV
jgi:hypothetical protein